MDPEISDGHPQRPPTLSNFVDLQECSMMELLTGDDGKGMDETSTTPPGNTGDIVQKRIQYRECLRNHAVNTGGYSIDGCGEFMSAGKEGTSEAAKCAACDCHRNFHRRVVEVESASCSCSCAHQDKNEKLDAGGESRRAVKTPDSVHKDQTRKLRGGGEAAIRKSDNQDGRTSASTATRTKRHRTKFSAEEKEKMSSFADKLGWKISKGDEQAVQAFCAETGFTRQVLKAWMQNHKRS